MDTYDRDIFKAISGHSEYGPIAKGYAREREHAIKRYVSKATARLDDFGHKRFDRLRLIVDNLATFDMYLQRGQVCPTSDLYVCAC
jgi:hypothetical protein